MCLITYLPPGVMPVKEHLDNGALLNPHGHGFSIGWTRLGSMDAEKVISEFIHLRARNPQLPAMFHSRNATGDSPVTLENIHPFRVSPRGQDAFAAHNGYMFPHEGERSDSRIFAEEILPRYDLDDRDSRALLEHRMGRNKAVILRPGYPVRILNRQQGIMLGDGTWHSNPDYLGISHHVPGFCPQCGTATDDKPVCLSCEGKAQSRRALLMRGMT